MRSKVSHIALLLFAMLCMGCGSHTAAEDEGLVAIYTPRYAKGFEILCDTLTSERVLRVTKAWQSDREYSSSLRLNSKVRPSCGVKTPVERVVVMSSSYVAMFDALGEVSRIAGVSGGDYISNDAVRRGLAEGRVFDVGYDSNLRFEQMKACGVDLVLLYGISGEETGVTSKLRELDIPYIYIGDYVEQDPLGKAEWLVAMAALCDNVEHGADLFAAIESRYLSLRDSIARNICHRPRVMLNTPYRDSWFMPSSRSYIVRLVEDAGGEYVYTENEGAASVPISLERALVLASQSEVWLDGSIWGSLEEFLLSVPRFANVPPVVSSRVYTSTHRLTPSGGSDFWESGAVQPDVILHDLAEIFHKKGENLYYYKHLE